jgi:hypothetical protein
MGTTRPRRPALCLARNSNEIIRPADPPAASPTATSPPSTRPRRRSKQSMRRGKAAPANGSNSYRDGPLKWITSETQTLLDSVGLPPQSEVETQLFRHLKSNTRAVEPKVMYARLTECHCVKQVMKQTKARILRGDTRTEGKIFSLFESSTEIIRKGQGWQAQRIRRDGETAGSRKPNCDRLRSL